MILHTVSKSPFHSDVFASCIRLAADSDSILLIEDGVYAILADHPLPIAAKLYALRADIEARGLQDKVPNDVQLIEDGDFVSLTLKASSVQSWY